jgi:hypothetical protein
VHYTLTPRDESENLLWVANLQLATCNLKPKMKKPQDLPEAFFDF